MRGAATGSARRTQLSVRLFGGPALAVADGAPFAPPTRKAAQIVAYLGLRAARWCFRAEITAAIWPDLAEERARACLDTELWRLRKGLAAAGGSGTWLEAEQGRLRLAPAVGVDAAEFVALLKPQPGEDDAAAERRLAAAITLQGDDFVPGETADWIASERAVLKAKRHAAMESLARILERQERWLELGSLAEALLQEDPLLEDVHRMLMRAHASRGDRPRALRQYNRLAEILARELQVEPMPETRALRRSIAAAAGDADTAPLDGIAAARLDAIAAELAALASRAPNRR